jgi:hypothetical protein
MIIAGYAWTAANFWRALFGRVRELAEGGRLDYGSLELCFTGCVLMATVAGLIWSLALAEKRAELGDSRTSGTTLGVSP